MRDSSAIDKSIDGDCLVETGFRDGGRRRGIIIFGFVFKIHVFVLLWLLLSLAAGVVSMSRWRMGVVVVVFVAFMFTLALEILALGCDVSAPTMMFAVFAFLIFIAIVGSGGMVRSVLRIIVVHVIIAALIVSIARIITVAAIAKLLVVTDLLLLFQGCVIIHEAIEVVDIGTSISFNECVVPGGHTLLDDGEQGGIIEALIQRTGKIGEVPAEFRDTTAKGLKVHGGWFLGTEEELSKILSCISCSTTLADEAVHGVVESIGCGIVFS